MTDTERALLLALAKVITSGFDTPFRERRVIQDLVASIKAQEEMAKDDTSGI